MDFNVVMTDQAQLVEVQGTAEGAPFERDTLNQLLSLADEGIQQLIERQREIVGAYLTKA